MKLKTTFLTGVRLTGGSGALGLITALAGAPGPWVTAAFLSLFLGGVIDVTVAVLANALALLAGDGDDARRRSAAPRGRQIDFRNGKAEFEGVRYPMGLSRFTPGTPLPPSMGVTFAEFSQGWASVQASVQAPLERLWPPPAPWPSQEKRLIPASPRESWKERGIEFPALPAYSNADRYGLRQSPFPVHFKVLSDGVIDYETGAMGPLVEESHTDPHPECPVCDAWLREHGR